MQQGQGVALGFELGQQSGVEAGNPGFNLLDMPHQLVEHEEMARGEVALQGIEQLLPAGFEPAAGELEH
jgi:hypothetical protein